MTGAAGNMGRLLRPSLRAEGRVLRLADLVEVTDPVDGEESVVVDVTDPEAVAKACQDVDAILHLGGSRARRASTTSSA
jgi:nucleoside-diphosphate-sugar epimerase